jgi:hypothetical protein
VDFLYYWQLFREDTANGPIFKLNQNSPVMEDISIGDDVWALALTSAGAYDVVARFTVTGTGRNPAGSPEDVKYGRAFFRSTKSLSNYFDIQKGDAEAAVRTLSINARGAVLGQCFQGHAAVRPLSPSDRERLIRYVVA